MARLLSLPVLGGGMLLASPALSAALSGTMPVETAGVRLLGAVIFVWLGLTLILSLVEATSPPRGVQPPPGQQEQVQRGGPVQGSVVDPGRLSG